MNDFSCLTTPINSGTVQLLTPEASSTNSSVKSNGSLHLVDEDLLKIQRKDPGDDSHRQPCACTLKAFRHHEDACINLQWAVRGLVPVTPAEMLQCLKRVMEGYHELLDCHSHQYHPETISLLLSTCDVMVAGTERLSCNVIGEEAGDGVVRDPTKCKMTIAPHIPRSGNSHNAGQYFGHFFLDEEDERCVFQSLVAVRTRRLSALIERLHEVADRHGRPVHIRLIHNLQDRCKIALESLIGQERH